MAKRTCATKPKPAPRRTTANALAREYDRVRKQLARERDRTQVIKDIVTAGVAALRPPLLRSYPEPDGPVRATLPQAAVLDLSDWHFGENVTAADVHDRAPYNIAVARLRARQVTPAVMEIVNLARSAITLDDLLVILGGDFFSGENIFRGHSHVIEINVLQQMLEGATLLAGVLNELSSGFKTMRVVAVPGNHGRLGAPGDYHHRSNLEMILYEMVAAALKDNDRVSLEVHNQDVVAVNFYGHCIGVGHGQFLAKGKAVTKDTIVQRAASAWPKLLRQELDMVFVHHWHCSAFQDVSGTKVFLNGSLVGGNYYSGTVLRTYSPPEQYLVHVNARRVTGIYLIDFLGHAHEALGLEEPGPAQKEPS